ncbi:MAG: hypothetical protein SOU16_10200 [Faecalimonas sp.]|nr:hypothetical protein [Faecalimonas sp.]
MNVLEKILEEIEHEAMTNKEIGRKQCEGMARAMNIIRSHMNDVSDNVGWIPAEKNPKESNYYMACIYNGEVDDYDFRKTWFAHVDDYDMDESEWRELYDLERVVAWQPLPKPYKPKKDITASGEEHIMSRFMKAE